jgi:hypothetical protein
MSLQSRFRDIVAAFGRPVCTSSQGTIFRPPAPIDLPACLGRSVARRLAADRIEPLCDFGVRMPGGGAAVLGILWIGHRGGVICVDAPPRGSLAVAAVMPAGPAIMSDFLLRFLGRNGRSFGVEFLPGPPFWIRNYRPDLLDRRAMKRALWAWMTYAVRRRTASWQAVRAHVADRWGRDQWPEVLSHEHRRNLLGMYLAVSYVEVVRGRRDRIDAGSALLQADAEPESP